MYKTTALPSLKHDLNDISTYLIHELGAYEAVDRLIRELRAARKRLSAHPYMYQAYKPAQTLFEEYRLAPLSNFILLYTVNEQTQTVSLCRLLYGRRDFERLL